MHPHGFCVLSRDWFSRLLKANLREETEVSNLTSSIIGALSQNVEYSTRNHITFCKLQEQFQHDIVQSLGKQVVPNRSVGEGDCTTRHYH